MAGAGSIARIGGHVALDFANTAGWHASAARSEWLTSYGEWLAWLGQSGAVSRATVRLLAREADRQPARTRRALARTVEARELVYRVFAAIAQRQRPHQDDLQRLHLARVAALAAATPEWGRGGPSLSWPDAARDLTAPIHPLMLAANALLGGPLLTRVRQCGNHPCGWLFIDRSKNGSRRWCSSAECGNATRVRRFRARQGSD
jgi:predicted RNA-binding Zn ribbon-like protein